VGTHRLKALLLAESSKSGIYFQSYTQFSAVPLASAASQFCSCGMSLGAPWLFGFRVVPFFLRDYSTEYSLLYGGL
jgi:hypothetical protein